MRPPHASALPSAVEWSHYLVKGRVQPGDWVVDATAGNGYDTAFLAAQVGAAGRVFAFDIQLAAHTAAQAHLAAAGLLDRCVFHLAGHEAMHRLLPPETEGKLSAVMMNLGYLPGQDKDCITRSATTLLALEAALDWLRPGGIATVVVYPGHPGGDAEAVQVMARLEALDSSAWEVQQVRAANRRRKAPECWAVVRRERAG